MFTWRNDVTFFYSCSLVMGVVAVIMALGTGHGPLLVWKIVARLSLLFDFDPFADVPNGGRFGGFYSNDTV